MGRSFSVSAKIREKTRALRQLLNMPEPGTRTTGRLERFFVRNMRILLMVASWDALKRLRLHAQALTYVTLLALVPLLVLFFSVIGNFGAFGSLEGRVQTLILDHLAGSPSVRTEVAEPILRLVSSIDAGHMGLISLVILIFSVLSLLGHIEFSINSIFGTAARRSWLIRLLTYWAILTLGPVLLMASFALTAAFQSSAFLEVISGLGNLQSLALYYLPFTTTWLALAVMYLVIPNTKVSMGAAFGAAFVAGGIWNTAKYGYASYVSHAFTLENVYGSLAVIPLFILWLYISWLIVLFGAQLTFAFHNSETYRYEEPGRIDSRQTYETAGVRLMTQIVLDYKMGSPTRPRRAAIQAGIPRTLLQTCLEELVDCGYVRKMAGENAFVPAKDPKILLVSDMLTHFSQGRGHQPAFRKDELQTLVEITLGYANPANHPELANLSFADLADRLPSTESLVSPVDTASLAEEE